MRLVWPLFPVLLAVGAAPLAACDTPHTNVVLDNDRYDAATCATTGGP
jgi:hypothetical protein